MQIHLVCLRVKEEVKRRESENERQVKLLSCVARTVDMEEIFKVTSQKRKWKMRIEERMYEY